MTTKSSKILISAAAIIFLSLIISAIQPTNVWADGTETLGTPSIAIGFGSGIVAAGTGLVAQPQPLDIDVPGTVVQALLYWEGQMSTDVPGDPTIVLDGVEITGSLIGGQTFFFGGAYSSAFRADITGLGLVASGSNALSVAGCDFTKVCNGAGLMVIYDDGTSTSIDLRDGLDLAFFNFPEPRKSTVPQMFSFAPSSSDRLATLDMFFSSVAGSVSTGGPIRPNEIKIMVDAVPTTFVNVLNSNDGEEWDTFSTAVTIPAGASTLTVEAISTASFDPLGASFAWIAAALSLESPPPPGGEGCTPGYWKNHLEDWPPTGLDPEDDFDTTFGVDLFDPDITLGEAINAKGGGVKKLARHGTAALLSAAHPDVDYPFTAAEVIALVQAGDVDPLVTANELGCDIP